MQDTPFKRHEPLYLKYRPQALGELVGQEGVYRTLVNAIENDRLTHAYLFTGPRGTGKTSSARILAKSLNCKTAGRPTVTPCQTCTSCLEITLGNSPAVFEIDAASNNSVDDARALIERAPLVAVGGDFKVYIIDECHMLTKEAFNALLKTIEQPPPKVVFILATTEEHKVLPTIISRCQRLMFKLINQDDLGKHLRSVADEEGIEIEEDALQLIARRSGGGLRDALSNLDQASLLAAPGSPATVADLLRLLGALHEDVLLDMSKQIANRDGQQIISSVGQFLAEGREPQVVLQELSRHFLSLMKASYLTANQQKDSTVLKATVLGSESYLSGLLAQVSSFERAELSQIIEQLDQLEQTCRRSSQPAMHLEIGLLNICHRHDIHLLKDLIARVQRLEEGGGVQAQQYQARPQQAPAQHLQQSHLQQSPQQSHSQQSPQQSQAQQSPQSPPRPAVAQSPQSHNSAPAHDQAPVPHASQAQSPVPPPGNSAASRSQQDDSAADGKKAGEEITSIAYAPANDSAVSRPTASPPSRPGAAPAAPDASAGSGEEESDDPRIKQLNADIEYFWQQVLDELQRRHLPTFSLASTHAFPMRISAREVAIGVMKDSFQKMLESKTEHLRTACQAVTGLDLAIRIRVAEANTPIKKPQAPSRPLQSSGDADNSQGRPAPQAAQAGVALSEREPHRAEEQAGSTRSEPEGREPVSAAAYSSGAVAGSPNVIATGEFDATMVKEAYKLFEGPGSRRIN